MRGLPKGLLRTWLPLLWVSASASSLDYCGCHVVCLCPFPHLRRKSSLPQVAKIRPAEAARSSAGKSQGLSGRRKAKWVIRGKPSCGAACANTSCPGCPARDGGGSRGLVPGGSLPLTGGTVEKSQGCRQEEPRPCSEVQCWVWSPVSSLDPGLPRPLLSLASMAPLRLGRTSMGLSHTLSGSASSSILPEQLGSIAAYRPIDAA
ncbi:uncharacterized protein LOC121677172 [Arvicola amphibius]|uniref:uncharacterized protein LOC121677172 n=1 Tax=Arvicola amphibius TaxID=1047088 RepID=UPI001C09F11E|nr:uncharacterized protein LOC121677172 [Arvicola amphibius]